MKLLVVGGGGREHAIIKKLKENPSVKEIFALPGNGGIARDATCVDIAATDLDGVANFAKERLTMPLLHLMILLCLVLSTCFQISEFHASVRTKPQR